MELTVSQYIAKVVKAQGVSNVFELSGGMIMHLLDAISQEGGIEIVNVYHEQAAAFAADAEGRLRAGLGLRLGRAAREPSIC
ncbi:MAG TPA: thiamine pyrophosphate-binding protein [Verrucomicrobiae bacterium]